MSLVEYAKGVQSPRKVWKRVLEAAIGLQYLHNLGIIHGDITSDCVVVGSNRKAKVKPLVCKELATEASKESDVYALACVILDAVSTATIEDSEHSFSSMEEQPEQPGGVSNAAWKLVEAMRSADPTERPEMDAVVRVVLTLTERERPWSDEQFPELLLHAPDVWTALRSASQAQETGVEMCAHVLSRLEPVLARLWDEGIVLAEAESGELNWQTRTEHLLRSMRFLTTRYLPSRGGRELLKMAHSRRFSTEIQQIHRQLDALFAEFDSENSTFESDSSSESSRPSAEEWGLAWEYDVGDLTTSFHEYLDSLEQSSAARWVRSDVAMEALTVMRHELDNFRYAFSDSQLDLVVRAVDVCAQHVGALVTSTPDWFISTYEVRDESWWEGARVAIQEPEHASDGKELSEVVPVFRV
ncbi:hypothetical protein GN958_ATG10761 [Phytophthora infestans]|uniref:Protein kinase domain-containing protein n=1 Tax=Phytophthora infestans TaxID=4787 RepID=A0A8S9UGV5_PHYIN|nr:hypothetical protein GN958_ATG10761 [Phytophthora infestans]